MILWFRNFYECVRCGEKWEDEWSCMCNDRCPVCHTEMTPSMSFDLSRNPVGIEYEHVFRRLGRQFSLSEAENLVQGQV